MSERDTRTNQDIRIPTLGGLNERPSPANLRPGEFSHLEGLYPAQIGLLRRIPGKTYLAGVNGRVLQIYATGNANGDVLVQTDAPARYVFTLDELRARATTPSLVFPNLSDEETMSQAIIVHREANAVSGGSIRGFISGTDSAGSADTFYGRRLTSMLVNESSTVVTFTASTGGVAAVSTPGTFVLAPGTYRLTGHFLFGRFAVAGNAYICGLYNNTDSGFEVYSGTSTPILSTVASAVNGAATDQNMIAVIDANFTVIGGSKTFQIMQKCSLLVSGQQPTACGAFSGMAGVNVTPVGGVAAAATFHYGVIKILKTTA